MRRLARGRIGESGSGVQKFTAIPSPRRSDGRAAGPHLRRPILRSILRGGGLQDAIRLLQARELQRAREFGPRWRLLSDLGGLSVALAITASGGAPVGRLADQLQYAGVASRSRVHGLVRTLVHLDGVSAGPHPDDRRVRRLAPRPWLVRFLEDWVDGQRAALSLCLPRAAPAGAFDLARFDRLLRRDVRLAGPFARLGWLWHAVGGTLWLLTLLMHARAHGRRAYAADISFKALSRDSGISRAHFAHLRSQAEARGLVRRDELGPRLHLSRAFHARALACVARWMAAIA